MTRALGHLGVDWLSVECAQRAGRWPWQRAGVATRVLDDVSIEVAPGEFVVVVLTSSKRPWTGV